MTTKAIFFGSIGAVVETSEIQREAYNKALGNAGLSWTWDRETYCELLEQAGGKERLRMLARATGTQLSDGQIDAIHADKTRIAGELLRARGALPRPGVGELIARAKEHGLKLALVTTTYRANIDAVFDAVEAGLVRADFDYVGTREDVEHGKPAPEAYERALSTLGLQPDQVIAIEDTANSVMSAKRAGIVTVATPGELTRGQDFWQADAIAQRSDEASLVRQVERMIG